MSTRLTTGLLSCLFMPLFVGCATSPGLIRGQSPVPPAPGSIDEISEVSTTTPKSSEYPFPYDHKIPQMMQSHIQHKAHAYGNPYCNDCYNQGQKPHWDGKKWCNSDGTPYWGWAPTHMYQHMYKIPQNMQYPQNPTPAAVTVYPYYTHKGPDDFFYTGE